MKEKNLYDNEPFLSFYLGPIISSKEDHRLQNNKTEQILFDSLFDEIDKIYNKGEILEFEKGLNIPYSTFEHILKWFNKKHTESKGTHSAEYTDFVKKVIYPALLKVVPKNINKLKLMFVANSIANDAMFRNTFEGKNDTNKNYNQINKYTVGKTFIDPKIAGIKNELNKYDEIKNLIHDYGYLSSIGEGEINNSAFVKLNYKPKSKTIQNYINSFSKLEKPKKEKLEKPKKEKLEKPKKEKLEVIDEIVKKEKKPKKNKYTPQQISNMKNLIGVVLFDNRKVDNNLTDKEETKAAKIMLNIQKIGKLPFNELLIFLKHYLKYNEGELNKFRNLFYYDPSSIGDELGIKITESEDPEDIRKENISDIKQFMYDINNSIPMAKLNKMKEYGNETMAMKEGIEKVFDHILELKKKAEETKPPKEKKPKTVYDPKKIEKNKKLINDYTFNDKMSARLLLEGAKNLFKLQKKGGDDDDVSQFSIVYLQKEPSPKELEQLREVFKIKQKK